MKLFAPLCFAAMYAAIGATAFLPVHAQSTSTVVTVPVPAGTVAVPARAVPVPATSVMDPATSVTAPASSVPLTVVVTPTTVTIGSTVIPVPTVVVTPPPPPPPATTAWVYHQGKFVWQGDWSFAVHQPVNYSDTTGGPTAGPTDILVQNTGSWGGWQPYLNANCQSNISLCFPTTPYKSITFQAKPTVANQVFQVGFMSSGDTGDGPVVVATPYCTGSANPAIGQWETCTMPLSVFKLTDTTVLKFWIQDQTGSATNHWFLQEVGFQ